MSLFRRKKHIRIRVFEEDSHSIYIRSRSFSPAEKADFDTICTLLEKMGFKPSERRRDK